MHRRLYGSALAAGLVLVAVGVASPASAANDFTVTVNPTSAKPGDTLTITGTAPTACSGGTLTVTQAYTTVGSAAPGDKTATSAPVTITGTTIDTTVVVPSDAVRSDAAEGSPNLPDTVTVAFDAASCGGTAQSSTPVAVTVLPLSTGQAISLTPSSPRTGTTVTVTSTDCQGGVIDAFIEDTNGNDFPIDGTVSGTTFTGTADLTGAVAGADAVAYVSCGQSELATADAVFGSNSAVDFTIAAAPAAPTPAPTAAPAPAAPPATAVPATPRFTG